MQSLIAVIFKEDMDRAEAYRVELRGREELAGLVDCSKMVAAVCDKEGKVHLQYTHALAKDGALIGGVWGALIGFLFLNPLLGIVAGAGLGAATGEVDDLSYVSPRTGRAVSRKAGEPYKDRLLVLPPFMLSAQTGLAAGDVKAGLDLTAHFLELFVFGPVNRPLPPARVWLVERLAEAQRL